MSWVVVEMRVFSIASEYTWRKVALLCLGKGSSVTLSSAYLTFYQEESSMRRGAREKPQAFVPGGQ